MRHNEADEERAPDRWPMRPWARRNQKGTLPAKRAHVAVIAAQRDRLRVRPVITQVWRSRPVAWSGLDSGQQCHYVSKEAPLRNSITPPDLVGLAHSPPFGCAVDDVDRVVRCGPRRWRFDG